MTNWNWKGARWWKFDLHAHAPASDDYGKGQNREILKTRSPKEWLLDYMKAGIDCVSITDHNSGAWIDILKEALSDLTTEKPEEYRELYLFPGTEITVNGGIHVLAIFDPSKSSSDIDQLLGKVEYEGKKGNSDTVTCKAFAEVVEAVVSVGGIVIPAHVDENNGLLSLKGGTLQQALDCDNIFAMELMDKNFQMPQLYVDKKKHWTQILGSDSHHPSGSVGQRFPGSHFTWIKMSKPCIEGLRLALLDGPLSIRRSDETEDDPNAHGPEVIESIDISEAQYIGRSETFSIKFNPWLNAIIGGRGTGKSTVVEFLRIALRRRNELPDELKEDFEKYENIYTNRNDSGLMRRNTAIRVIYRKNGARFRIQWNPAGTMEPIEQMKNNRWTKAEGDIKQRFPLRIYSQKQIFQLAKAPLALLKVVDDAPEVDRRSWEEKWNAEKARFLSLRAKAREIESALPNKQRLQGELDDIKRKMEVFEKDGHAEILKNYQKRKRQNRKVELWEESWSDIGEQLRNIASEIVPDNLEENDFDLNSEEETKMLGNAEKTAKKIEEISKKVLNLAAEIDAINEEWKKTRNESKWKKSVVDAEKAYQKLVEKLSEAGVGDPAVYGELVQRRQNIEQKMIELKERKKQVEELSGQADEHIERLTALRRDITIKRRKFLNEVLRDNHYVSITIVPYGARESSENEFSRLINREDGAFEKDIGSIEGHGLLGELYRGVDKKNAEGNDQAIERNVKKIKNRVKKITMDSNDDNEFLSDKRFVAHLKKLTPETLDRIELWFPEDSLEIRYSTTADGKKFRSIQEGSPGQKTAALLAFLLSYGEEPLILDQPEDDLDNHLIYDLIVTQLRDIKRRRQVIVVTHNANIVVNGDAEFVIGLKPGGGETHKECEGSLQEKSVREVICAVMEGGRKAFEERYRRIALEGINV